MAGRSPRSRSPHRWSCARARRKTEAAGLAALLTLLFAAPLTAPAAHAQGTPAFSASGLQGAAVDNPTSLQFGPDGRLYVAQQDGTLFAFTVARNGTDDYAVTATETIALIKTGVPNHNDDGTPNGTAQRQVTGLLVAGTAAQPVVYVTSSDWRISVASDSGLDTNSGVLTRLTCTGGLAGGQCQGWTAVDLVRGLPRSEENHSTNGMDLDPVHDVLYLMNGGNANKGVPSNNFSGTGEYFFSAAMLSVDLGALEAMPVYTDPRNGRAFVYDLPTLDDPTRADLTPGDPGYPYGPGHPYYDNGYAVDVGDPFGGHNGLNQAIPEPGGPVQVYSPGYRNGYDVVYTTSGDLYTWDNGPNTGWGGTARIYDAGGHYKGYDPALYDPGAGDYCTGELNEDGSNGHDDPLKRVTGPGYYGGHQNPLRAFPSRAGIFNYVQDGGGNWVHQGPPGGYAFADLLPAWLSLADFPDDPAQCAYAALDDGLEVISYSTNGLDEYTASNFDGAMAGDLLVASFNGNVYRCKPDGNGGLVNLPGSASGTAYGLCEVLFGGFGSQPLDVTAEGDAQPFPGTVWAATYGASAITVFEPQDFGACDTSDPDGDADGDGYSNGDEADNGTNPCSGGSVPDDNDHDFVSDLNDPDDDNDGALDVDDPFALDADDGTTTELPLSYALFNNDPGTGLFGLGFTGLMLPEDGATTWLDLFDPEELAAGGTAGLFTVEAVTPGEALGGENTQENGFLFGVDVDASTPPFVVRTRVLPPFFAIDGTAQTPVDNQSFGLFVGTGDQDDYLKVVFNANGGAGGVLVVKEVGGVPTAWQYGAADWGGADILAATSVDFSLLIDPQALTAQPRVALGATGAVFDLGAPVALPAAWLAPGDGRGLAVGTIATSDSPGGTAPAFSATWDFFEVTEAPSTAEALVQVTPDGALDADVSDPGAFSIQNLSAGAAITSVTFDVSTAALPDLVFDPNGTAGDTAFRGFTPVTDNGTVPYNLAFGGAHDGGYQTLTLNFTDFQPGETFAFWVDVDPTMIQGAAAPGPGASGHVSGLELSGTTVTVTFSDGSVHTAALFRGAEGAAPGVSTTLGGGENVVRSPAPAQPTLGVAGVTLAPVPELPAHFRAATVGRANQTAHVDGPVGATVRLLVLEATRFEPAGGGHDVDPFEADDVTAVSEQTAVITSPEGVDFPVTLVPLDAGTDPTATATYNYLVATVEDQGDGMTGPPSDVAVLAYDPTILPTVLFRVNAGGEAVAAIDGGIAWSADTEDHPSPYHNLACEGCNRTSSFGPPLSVDPSVDQSTTPLAVFDDERWDPAAPPEMHWAFPTGDGSFIARLYLMNGYEDTSGPGQRVFDINVEGGPVEVEGLDLSGQYGHRVAVMLDFPVTVTDGTLDIEFIHEVENPLVDAIEILGGSTLASRPPALGPIADQQHGEGDAPALAVAAAGASGRPLTFAASGLPPGLAIEPATGRVSGTIAAGAAAGSPYAVTVTATDAASGRSSNAAFTWTVGERGALLRVTPGEDLGASTYSSNSFQISNVGTVAITAVSIDASTTYFRDLVFDPDGTAGDDTAKCLTPDDTVGDPGYVEPADPCTDPFSHPHDADGDGDGDPDDGYDVVTLHFTDFDGGEQFNFSVDQDPNSIKGDNTAGDAGSVSGFENVGATVKVTFADGAVVTANLWEDGSLGGAVAVVPGAPAPAPALGTDVPLTPLDGDRAGATVSDPAQTLTVTGPPGAAFTLLQVDARLHFDAGGGGYDIDYLEANEAMAKALYTGTLDGSGRASVKVTLLQTPGSSGEPDGGINHFIAVLDGQGGRKSATSNVIVLALGDAASFDVTYDAGWSLVALPVAVPDANYLVVFDPASGGDPDNAQNVVPGTFYEFDGTYYTPDPPVLTHGVGAWLKFAQPATLTLEGGPVPSLERTLDGGGWYLFSGPSCTLPASALEDYPEIVDGTVYGFDGGYFPATTLEPGRSYWARVADGTGPLTITLACDAAARPGGSTPALARGDGAPARHAGREADERTEAGQAARARNARGRTGAAGTDAAIARTGNAQRTNARTGEPATAPAVSAPAAGTGSAGERARPAGGHPVTADPDLTAFGTLAVSDADGRRRALNFGNALPEGASRTRFALPPPPPAGAFDARLDGDVRLTEGAEAFVHVQTGAFPLRVEAERMPAGTAAGGYALDVLVGGAVVATHLLAPGHAIDVPAPETGADEVVLHVHPAAAEALPAAFALVGVYPNPLRGAATVAFDLPAAADVRVEVYDLLGRRVAVAAQAAMEAGAARVLRLPADGLASGAYLLRIEAALPSGTAVATGRLTVVR